MNNTSCTLPPLLLTAIWSLLPISRHHAYVCSAGSTGYHALKEMLQNGKPGNSLLLESDDLRNLNSSTMPDDDSKSVAIILTYPPVSSAVFYSRKKYPKLPHVVRRMRHVSVYSNREVLPFDFITDSTILNSIDMSHVRISRCSRGSFFTTAQM